MEIPSAVTDARSEAARLGKTASDYAGEMYTVPDQLRRVVQEALNYNKDVVGLRSTAMADYMASPAEAGKKFGVETFSAGAQAGQRNPDYIFNPFERNAAQQGFVANQSIPFNTANTLLGMREGTIADTVDAGTRAFQAKAAAANTAAQAAQQTYQNVLNEFKTIEDMKVQQKQLGQEQQRIDISRKTAGGGAGLDLASMFASLAKLGQVGTNPAYGAINENDGASKPAPQKEIPIKQTTQASKFSAPQGVTSISGGGTGGGKWALQPAADWIRGLFLQPEPIRTLDLGKMNFK